MGSFGQFLGGTVGLAVGQAAFASELGKRIREQAPSAPFDIIRQSPLAIYTDLPKELIPAVVKGYVQALDVVFILGVPFAILGLGFAFFIKDISIKRPKEDAPAASPSDTTETSQERTNDVKGGDDVAPVVPEEQEKTRAEDRV
jgi:hypothetical protein